MPAMTHAKNTRFDKRFMPASNSLATGIVRAAFEDICLMMKSLGNLMLEIWLEAVYNTASFIQRLR